MTMLIRPMPAPTIVEAGERHLIDDFHNGGARVLTRCRREVWRAPADHDHGEDVPACAVCFSPPSPRCESHGTHA